MTDTSTGQAAETRASAVPTVALVGTLDTKGAEYQWMSEQLVALGVAVVAVDAGIRDPHGYTGAVAFPQTAVAEAAGTTIDALRDGDDRGAAVARMGEGAAAVLAQVFSDGGVDAVLALGGSGGSAIAARAVRDLPIGLPKLIVSTMASGDVSPYVGASDVTMMYSVVDIAGINQISRSVLGNAAAAAAGMAAAYAGRGGASTGSANGGGASTGSASGGSANGGGGERPLIGASMFGVTTPAVDAARERLDELGYEVLVFHATGSGGRALEALARSNMLVGVLDLTTTELADELVGGVLTAGPDRVTAAGASGTPQVVSLGALDMVNFGPEATVPAQFADRHFFVHNPTITLMRTTVDENAELGRSLGAKLAAAESPTILMIPHGGVSALDAAGQPFRDVAADEALIENVTAAVEGSAVTVLDLDANINDPLFGRQAADELHALITKN
ncbi:Tm-1-like ATP-binding domain-containing protein [Agreia sp. Leaf244]|uniref:Tm-1-like ATP-binding domain-containing protein n=1 Tax=Agreia sp. Leaf244 TaxID=1736305 RepID=UPI000B25E1BE|nr:Tm-1-like ATP-binding domain-containing protein [Agreia sp. Leaf244]